ncbi:MAG: nucleotidyltransferase domain-containing protein [Saprospiraceae bacterium]
MNQHNSFGKAIRHLRNEQKLPLRTVAAYLDIDQAILSKIESGHKKPPRDFVSKIALYFNQMEDELVALWLSDRVLYEIGEETMGPKALDLAKEQFAYQLAPVTKGNIISRIQSILRKDVRIDKAWLFGSFARNEQKQGSDIDLMIRFNEDMVISLFDLADIKYKIEEAIGIRVDLVEEESIAPDIVAEVNMDRVSIYG